MSTKSELGKLQRAEAEAGEVLNRLGPTATEIELDKARGALEKAQLELGNLQAQLGREQDPRFGSL